MADPIDDILRREGFEIKTHDPLDHGGRTQYGISEKSNPQAWADGKVTEEEARAIYLRKYVNGPRLYLITDQKLRDQLIDFGVNSGPQLAIQKLQLVLGVDADGIIGEETLKAIGEVNPTRLNALLMAERIKMIGRIVHKNPSQLKFLNGWLNRALEFI